MMQTLTAALLLVFGASLVCAHPVYHHKLKALVESDPCLKKCMDEADGNQNQENRTELNLLKTADVSGYLLNLDTICSTISTAKECITSCRIDDAHNPFILESVMTVCSKESIAEVKLLEPCLRQVNGANGSELLDTCKTRCGDHDEVNDDVSRLSAAFTPETHTQEKETEFMSRINEACSILKCTDRYIVRTLSEQCGKLSDGRDAGAVLTSVIERVLHARRRDLERRHLVDTMAHSVPIQCNYMYMPEVMLNETADKEAMREIDLAMKGVYEPHHHQQRNVLLLPQHKHHHLMLAHSQMQTRLLQKQLEVLSLQENNLKKESEKLDLEIDALNRKAEKTEKQEEDDDSDEKEGKVSTTATTEKPAKKQTTSVVR